jgi:hypothetical protein
MARSTRKDAEKKTGRQETGTAPISASRTALSRGCSCLRTSSPCVKTAIALPCPVAKMQRYTRVFKISALPRTMIVLSSAGRHRHRQKAG